MLQEPHPALLVPDILDEICVHLRPLSEEHDLDESWATLASVARTCKVFHEPAARSLWWAIPGLEPVLQLLAATSLLSVSTTKSVRASIIHSTTNAIVKRSPVVNRSYTLPEGVPRTISPEHWERLRRRATHTRVIHEGSPRCRVTPAVYVFLSYKFNARPLFPNARTAAWHSEEPDHLSLLPLLSPTLQTLKLDLGEDRGPRTPNWWIVLQHEGAPVEGASVDQILQTVLPRLGSLGELEVRATTDIPYVREEASWACMGGLQHLRKLTLDQSCLVLRADSLLPLATLPVLEELSLCVTQEGLAALPANSGFAALQKLSVEAFGRPNERILDPFVSPNLHTVSVKFDQAVVTTIPAVLNHIARSYPSIRSVAIVERSGQTWQDGNTLPTFDAVFGALSTHAAIEEFTLHTDRKFSVSQGSADDLALLVQRWPRLRTFSFLASMFPGSPTHHTILAFAQHCPSLRVLHLRSAYFADLTKVEVRALPAASGHALEEFGVCTMMLGGANTQRVARFLRKLFPALRVPKKELWSCPSCSATVLYTMNETRYTECSRALEQVFKPDKVPRAQRQAPTRQTMLVQVAPTGHGFQGTGFVVVD